MKQIIIKDLLDISIPVMEGFVAVEPQPWTRKTVLLELVGEIGELAHLVQHWDGYKCGRPGAAQLADECSDVLFLILRLACSENIHLPETIELEAQQAMHASDLTLELSRGAAALQDPDCDPAVTLAGMLTALGYLSGCLGIDLARAHQREMEIALYFFKASGDRWPRPQPFRYPSASFRLARLLWKKRTIRNPSDI